MNSRDLIILNLEEIRRRSIMLWEALPAQYYFWKPDPEAMTAIEMVRHVLEADYGWTKIITGEDMSNYQTPWEGRPFESIADELFFAQPYRQLFLEAIQQFSSDDLLNKQIIHPGNNLLKPLGQYLLRIGYHESVHAGQFTAYLRAMNVDRPMIWD